MYCFGIKLVLLKVPLNRLSSRGVCRLGNTVLGRPAYEYFCLPVIHVTDVFSIWQVAWADRFLFFLFCFGGNQIESPNGQFRQNWRERTIAVAGSACCRPRLLRARESDLLLVRILLRVLSKEFF